MWLNDCLKETVKKIKNDVKVKITKVANLGGLKESKSKFGMKIILVAKGVRARVYKLVLLDTQTPWHQLNP